MQADFQLHRYQRGISMPALLILFMVMGFGATAMAKLGPAYMDNQKATSALESLKTQYASKDLREVSDKAIVGSLKKILSVNLVNPILVQSIKVQRSKGDVLVSINYEIRNNFMSNIDAVIVFENEVNLAD